MSFTTAKRDKFALRGRPDMHVTDATAAAPVRRDRRQKTTRSMGSTTTTTTTTKIGGNRVSPSTGSKATTAKRAAPASPSDVEHARKSTHAATITEVAGLIRAKQCRVVLFEKAKRPQVVVKEGWIVRRNAWDAKTDEPRYFMMTRTELLHFATEPQPKGSQPLSTTSAKLPKTGAPYPLIRRPGAKDVIPLRSVIRAFRVPRGETEAHGFEQFNDGHFVIVELPSKSIIMRAKTIKDAQDWARVVQAHVVALRQTTTTTSLPPTPIQRDPAARRTSQGKRLGDGDGPRSIGAVVAPLASTSLRASSPATSSPGPHPSLSAMTSPRQAPPPPLVTTTPTFALARNRPSPKSPPGSSASNRRRALAKASPKMSSSQMSDPVSSDKQSLPKPPPAAAVTTKQTQEEEKVASRSTFKVGSSPIVAFYESATSCYVCREDFRLDLVKRPCGKCVRPCCGLCLGHDIHGTSVCGMCFSEHAESIACASRKLSSDALEHLVPRGAAAAESTDGKDSDLDFDEEHAMMAQYYSSINLGAPMRAVVRSMKQNGVSDKHARSFAAQVGNAALTAYSEFYEGDADGSLGTNELPPNKPMPRDTITVQIEAKFREGILIEGSLFDFGPSRQQSDDLLPLEIAEAKKAFCSMATAKVPASAEPGVPSAVVQQATEVTFVTVQRAQNIAIALRRFKASSFPQHTDILYSIGEQDLQQVTTAMVELLVATVPTADEVRALRAYSGDPLQLRTAERWMALLCSSMKELPVEKFRGFVLGQTLKSRISFVLNKCSTVTTACIQVIASRRFQRMVEATLQLCNLLNKDTRLGDADALSLASLSKLNVTRVTNGDDKNERPTLLEYLVKFLDERGEGDVCKLLDDMPDVGSAAQIEQQHIYLQCQELAKDFEMLQKIIAHEDALGTLTTSDSAEPRRASLFFRSDEVRKGWLTKMRSICGEVAVELLAVQAATEQMARESKKLSKYCCEDSSSPNSGLNALRAISQFTTEVENAVRKRTEASGTLTMTEHSEDAPFSDEDLTAGMTLPDESTESDEQEAWLEGADDVDYEGGSGDPFTEFEQELAAVMEVYHVSDDPLNPSDLDDDEGGGDDGGGGAAEND